jgi:hypothetical protein
VNSKKKARLKFYARCRRYHDRRRIVHILLDQVGVRKFLETEVGDECEGYENHNSTHWRQLAVKMMMRAFTWDMIRDMNDHWSKAK